MWDNKYKSKVLSVRMDNFRELLGVRRNDKIRNEYVMEMCGVKKDLNKRINASILKGA